MNPTIPNSLHHPIRANPWYREPLREERDPFSPLQKRIRLVGAAVLAALAVTAVATALLFSMVIITSPIHIVTVLVLAGTAFLCAKLAWNLISQKQPGLESEIPLRLLDSSRS